MCGGVLWKRPVGREPVIEVGRGEKLHLQDHMIHRLEDSQKSHLQTRRKQRTENEQEAQACRTINAKRKIRTPQMGQNQVPKVSPKNS